MVPFSRLKKLFGYETLLTQRHALRRWYRPRVEGLETRVTPATLYVNSTGTCSTTPTTAAP